MAELNRESFGNAADESAAFENGADFDSLRETAIPSGRSESIAVDAEYVDGDVVLTPPEGEFARALSVLDEGPLDKIMHTIIDQEEEIGVELRQVNGVEVEIQPRRAAELTSRSPRESLVWYGMHPEYYGATLGDRIMVRKDILESEYSCRTCRGRGYDEEIVCLNCGGDAREMVNDVRVPCRVCRVLGFGTEENWSCGRRKCGKCNGSGWRNGIVIPQEAQQEAITGIVVSIGPDCKLLKLGDRVIHSRFAGHSLKVDSNNHFVIMRESEVLEILRQRR